jgi:hypothetical protein
MLKELVESSFSKLQILILPHFCRRGLIHPFHSEPTNNNQRLGLDYRNRQLSIYSAGFKSLIKRSKSAFAFNTSICKHGQHHHAHQQEVFKDTTSVYTGVELLSLECAFEWLRLSYIGIFDKVVEMIAKDQDEPLPLNWALLVEEGWESAYWVLWIFVLLLLQQIEGPSFQLKHSAIFNWLLNLST